MKEKVETIKNSLEGRLSNINNLNDLNDLRVEYLGKKGLVTELTSEMGNIPNEEKREFGILLNDLKNTINSSLEEKKTELEGIALKKQLENDAIDITLPATKLTVGSIHPTEMIIDEVSKLFTSMGYDVVEGPEVERDLYNFERLNLPVGHTARDAHDTFYITEEYLLRTHTSPVQARFMEANTEKTPVRIICPGKTYRRDNDDATHSHQFMQIEGLLVDKNITMAHLKETLLVMAKTLFGEEREIRLRPSYFPFTEPSVEMDITCFKCNHDPGCKICKGTGWIELGGAGMVHPNVLKDSGYDPNIYSGFAFGMGVERMAMLKYGINDLRTFYTNDSRFLSDFNRYERGDI